MSLKNVGASLNVWGEARESDLQVSVRPESVRIVTETVTGSTIFHLSLEDARALRNFLDNALPN